MRVTSGIGRLSCPFGSPFVLVTCWLVLSCALYWVTSAPSSLCPLPACCTLRLPQVLLSLLPPGTVQYGAQYMGHRERDDATYIAFRYSTGVRTGMRQWASQWPPTSMPTLAWAGTLLSYSYDVLAPPTMACHARLPFPSTRTLVQSRTQPVAA